MKNLDGMSKDELVEFAHTMYGLELNKRDRRADLVAQLENHAIESGTGTTAGADTGSGMTNDSGTVIEPAPSNPENSQATDETKATATMYLRHARTGCVFEATAALRRRSDMLPCDREGNTP